MFSQGVLRLGNIVPDFSCETTHGHWDSFHKWIGDSWCILFSHPADFTPGGLYTGKESSRLQYACEIRDY
jgi:peroxiredoxin